MDTKLPCQPFLLPEGKGASGHMPTTTLLDARRGDMQYHGCRGGGSTFLQFCSHTPSDKKMPSMLLRKSQVISFLENQGNTL